MRPRLGTLVQVAVPVVTVMLLAAVQGTPSAAAAEAPGTVGGEQLATSGLAVDAPGADPLPKVSGDAWVLADLETGEVLAAQDPHGRYRPASVLKILTALTTLPALDPDAVYTAQWEDANAEGSRVGLVPDATYTVHNLFEALFLVSGNDAATAIANAAGGVRSTVAEMNRTARDLGALDTTARNPSGLDAGGQFTSAYDLAVITRAAMAREDVRSYVSTVKSQFPGKMPRSGKARKTYEIYTQDRLLLNYRGAIGVKTGWTTKARGTFVGAAERGGRTLVATVLHSEGDAWRDSAALLTWGFHNAGVARPVGTLDALQPEAAGTDVGPSTSDGGQDGSATAAAGSPAESGGGLPWWLQTLVVLLGVVAVLRARVLLRRRLRRVRAVRVRPVPQPRDRTDRRRVTTAAAAAPTPAPTAAPRHDDLRDDEPPATSSASSGTAS
jgi:D-alanyl-D-alanine carboxypeptidase (penicillin-binding protein 5/6)